MTAIFRDLQARAAYLAQAVPHYEDIAPQPDWINLVNRAYQDFSWDTEYNYVTSTFTTVQGTAEYLLSAVTTPMFKFLTDVIRDSAQDLKPSDEVRERDRNPMWLVVSQAPPVRYWMSGPNTIRLHPVPDASTYVITFRGCCEATALVADNDAPTCPTTYWEAIVLRAAVLHIEPFMQDQATAAKLEYYRGLYGGLVKSFRKALASDDIQKQKSVSPRLPERVWAVAGWRGWDGI